MMNLQPVIMFTTVALKHIEKNITGQQALGFRLGVKQTGCSGYTYVPEIIKEKRPEDLEYQYELINVFIDKNSAKYLQGTLIDFVDEGLGQSKLLFKNPNAASLCGCGESFNLLEESAD
jgi:iron-sulfur cluster assembly protein